VPIDSFTIDEDCIDFTGCAPLSGTFNTTSLPKPKQMSTNVLQPRPDTPSVLVT